MGNLMNSGQSEQEDTEKRTGLDILKDSGRALAQGITFGSADELEAFIRSYIDKDKSYSELAEEIRTDIKDYRKNSPWAAYGLEILGSIPTGIMGVGKTLGSTAIRSAIASGVYGFNTGEGKDVKSSVKDRLLKGAIAAPIGATAGPLIQKVAPSLTAKTAELLRKGVNLTPGQAAMGGYFGALIKRLEEGATSLPLVGGVIKGALDRSTQSFNRAAINDALKSINKVLPPKLTGRKAIEWAKNEISKSYNDVVSKMSLNNADELIDIVSTISTNLKGSLDPKLYKIFNDKLSEKIISRVKDGKLSGTALQKVQTDIKALITQYIKNGGTSEREMADALTTILTGKVDDAGVKIIPGLDDLIIRDNAPDLVSKFLNTNKAYSLFGVIQNASVKSKTGTFTPSHLLTAAKAADNTKNKSIFASGNAKLQKLAETGDEVVGANIADSGTAFRTGTQDVLAAIGIGAGQTVDSPISTGALLTAGGLAAAYNKVGQPIVRNALLGIGNIMQDSAVPISANISNKITPLLSTEEDYKALMEKNIQEGKPKYQSAPTIGNF
tara:strand:- start:529 stop:2193 length:1665 start_codon:yes stop_codon:yes gene_type:complete